MPFVRLKVKNGQKEDFNLAHLVRFSQNEDKSSTLILLNDDKVTVEESAQAVRGAIRRAEAPAKAEPEAPAGE